MGERRRDGYRICITEYFPKGDGYDYDTIFDMRLSGHSDMDAIMKKIVEVETKTNPQVEAEHAGRD